MDRNAAELDREVSTRVVAAVHRVLQADLAAQGAAPEAGQHVASVVDVLLHRAALEDRISIRRADRARELAELADRLALPPGAPDPFASITQAADALAAGALPAADVEELLRQLCVTDLPELGLASTPEQEAAAAGAMDWLGVEAPADLTPAQVAAYLSTRDWPQRPDVCSVRRLSGGFSKTTTSVVLSIDGRTEEVVLRQVPPGRDGSGLAAEYGVVRHVWERGVPAPEPLWLEADEKPLGGAFFATRRVPGTNVGDVFGPRAGITDPAPAYGLAHALARLHTLDHTELRSAPLAPMASRTDVLDRIAEERAQVAKVADVDGGIPRPLHELLFAWLRAHAPADLPNRVLLHGDPGLHNVLVRDGEIEALLDWERARIGEAEQDLAYVRPHVTPLVAWDDFIDAYCAAGGVPPQSDRLAYYAVWHDAWRFAGSYRARARLLTAPRTLLDAVTGLLHAPRFLLSGLQRAFEVTL